MQKRGYTVAGYAIMSADGFITDLDGQFPHVLRNDADQRLFRSALDRAAAVAMGRLTHEQEANAGRRRLVLTRHVAGIAPDPNDAKALLWNPAGAAFEAARLALGVRLGEIAVTGGAEVYAAFFDVGYDTFHLTVSHRVRMEVGKAVFPGMDASRTAMDVLRAHGLRPGPMRVLDPAAGVSLTVWSSEHAGHALF